MAQVDFPRGGSNVLSPLEVQNAKRKAEDDALFKTTPSTPLKKAKKIKSNTPATAKGKDIPSTDKDEVSVDAITISMYKKGVSVLGIVKEINPVDITVSLPGLLTGYIHITQMSSQMTQLLTRQLKSTELDGEDGVTQLDLNSFFRIGDMLRCVVDEVELTKSKHKRIKLAIDPKILNAKFKANRIQTGMTLSGYIESVEDHGYIVSFEIENLVGFLSQQEGLDYAKSRELEDLPVGLPVNCVIQKVKDQGRMVTVGVSSSKVLKAKAHEGMRFSYDTLQAGLYVNGTIAKISTKGAQLSFLGGFRGSVTADHLNQNQSLQERSKVVARIIYVDRKSKKIALSLLNITVNGQMDISQVEIGQIIEDAVVLRVDKGVGLLLQLGDNLKGYVHISRASDKHIDKFGKQHRAGSKHRCRVIANSLIDELAIITMQQSVLEQQFISYKDIKPGTLVMGKIISLEDFGILVQVTDHIKALCPRLHMSDITLKHPEKKFKEGNKIKCRVLTVDARRRRLILTHKKSMVHSSHVVITSYEEAQENVTAHGFISSVRSNGCFITFYNNVRGFVHKKYLSTQYIENPETVFFVGQVVLTYIVSVDAVNKKLSLSLKPPALTTSTSSNLKFNQSKVVDVDLFRATAEGLDVLMQPSGLAASVPVHHLSDFHSNSRALVNYFTSQQSVNKDVNTKFLKQLVTVGKTKSSVIASRKQSLVDAVQNKGVLQNFDQLKVTDIEHERKRFLVSLRLSDYLKSVGKDDAKMNTLRIFDQYLNERNTIIEAMKCVYEFPPTGILIGELVTGMIEAIDGNRVTLLLKKGQKAVSTISFDNADLKENSSVSARVIDFDLETRTVVVSLHPDMVSYSTKQFHKMQKQIKVQTNTEAIIELVTCDHIVCRLPNYRNILAVAPSSQYWNNVKSAHRRYSIGNRFTAHVER
ncbi:uncharacterized protein TRIADDRAFT_61471 [Trichoplax adhaerens]|uniref:S1 motif domain-containing protein n=1 Tax=Trichoplax adhaerens TaxID=10228 RepID=B3SB29_TRIAD|nr:hypothetical protein TRIADDRAFT_61471 [Trichoplax adhaerens]EDV20036.1 hypothetical protein TRIADDRAFT_61471 [Trichoplax adhaerens]|eukprot:XP_002117420.1 hypothetical protein TRIADDRAFT_61471 [Trichoplax adhaerens]